MNYPMNDAPSNAIQIIEYRLLLGVRIAALLEKNNSYRNIHDIQLFIFNASHDTPQNEHILKLFSWFNATEAQFDPVFALLEDAWNYFPHRALEGRSPAEVMLTSTTFSTARPRRQKNN